MKKLSTKYSFAALTIALASIGAPVAQAADAPAPEHAVSMNAAVTSDYRYRGLSQSRLYPAVQGGVDYTHNPTGFYAGVWASSIKWTKDLGGGGDAEIDLYGGKRGELGGISYDVGGLYYAYPSNGFDPSANTFELYGQLGFGPAYIKYSHATTDLFGTFDSKGSGYLDIGANVELTAGWVLNLHAGHQKVNNTDDLSYTDWKVGVTKDLGFATMSVAYVGTNTDLYISPANDRNLGKNGAVVTFSKTF